MNIPFEDFKKLDLKIAKILQAEHIENSEKLLKLLVTIGSEERQIIAGIGKVHEPDSLIGREIIVVVNLEPKQLMGLESQGMLLAANDGEPVLLVPEREVPPGTMIQ